MTPKPAASYRPLGALRFGLALLVTLQHFQYLLPFSRRTIFSHIGFGVIAVTVFFAVSGLVVAEANATFYAGRPGAFLANRAIRLVPPYLAALALSILVHAGLWHAGRLVLWDYTLAGSPLAPARLASGPLALLPGFDPRFLGQPFEYIPFVWTLRMEVAFYLAAAATMLACARLRATWPLRAAITAGLLLPAMFMLLTHRSSILSTMPMFLIGTSLYLLERQPGWRRAVLFLVSLLTAAMGFASWRQHGAPVLAWQLPLLGSLMALFAWLAMRPGPGRWHWLDRRLGDLSYPLYLNHYAVGIFCTSMALPSGWPLYAAAVIAAIAISWLAEKFVDRPLRRVRDRIRAARLSV